LSENKKFQSGGVASISIAHFLHDVYSSILAPVMPLLMEKLQFSYSMAGLLYVFQRFPALFNPLIGLAADKLPTRIMLIAAPSVTALSMGLIGIAPSYTIVAILLLITGISAATFHVPAPVVIKSIAGNRLGKGMSFFMFGGEIARSAGPVLILGAISLWGFEGIYKTIPAGFLASGILFFKLRKIRIAEAFKIKKNSRKASHTLKKIYPLLIKVAGVSFFMSIIKAALTSFLPVFFSAQGNTVWAGGIALAIVQLAGAFGTFSSGTISDKIGRRNTLLIIGAVSPVLMWVFVLFGSLAGAPILLLAGFFLFSSTSVLLAVVNEFKSERPAFVNGLFMTLNFISGAGSIMLIGLMSDWIGIELTYKISALLGFGALPFVFMLGKK